MTVGMCLNRCFLRFEVCYLGAARVDEIQDIKRIDSQILLRF